MIVVDNLVKWSLVVKSAQVRRVFAGGSCHMTSDTSRDELHRFATQMGLRRSWFQDHVLCPHYDLNGTRRMDAVRLGAVEVDRRGIVAAARKLTGRPALDDLVLVPAHAPVPGTDTDNTNSRSDQSDHPLFRNQP